MEFEFIGVHLPVVHKDGGSHIVTFLSRFFGNDEEDVQVVVAIEVHVRIAQIARGTAHESRGHKVTVPDAVLRSRLFGVEERDGIVFARFEIERREVQSLHLI